MLRNAASTSIIRAFLERRSARNRNDSTDSQTFFFHSSPIARHAPDGQLILSCCGHNTPSTRLRLNTICKFTGNGQPFNSKNSTLHFNASPISATDEITIQILRAATQNLP